MADWCLRNPGRFKAPLRDSPVRGVVERLPGPRKSALGPFAPANYARTSDRPASVDKTPGNHRKDESGSTIATSVRTLRRWLSQPLDRASHVIRLRDPDAPRAPCERGTIYPVENSTPMNVRRSRPAPETLWSTLSFRVKRST